MLDTNTESIGMVLLVACLVGVIASVVGIRIHTFQEIAYYQNPQTTLRNYKSSKM